MLCYHSLFLQNFVRITALFGRQKAMQSGIHTCSATMNFSWCTLTRQEDMMTNGWLSVSIFGGAFSPLMHQIVQYHCPAPANWHDEEHHLHSWNGSAIRITSVITPFRRNPLSYLPSTRPNRSRHLRTGQQVPQRRQHPFRLEHYQYL